MSRFTRYYLILPHRRVFLYSRFNSLVQAVTNTLSVGFSCVRHPLNTPAAIRRGPHHPPVNLTLSQRHSLTILAAQVAAIPDDYLTSPFLHPASARSTRPRRSSLHDCLVDVLLYLHRSPPTSRVSRPRCPSLITSSTIDFLTSRPYSPPTAPWAASYGRRLWVFDPTAAHISYLLLVGPSPLSPGSLQIAGYSRLSSAIKNAEIQRAFHIMDVTDWHFVPKDVDPVPFDLSIINDKLLMRNLYHGAPLVTPTLKTVTSSSQTQASQPVVEGQLKLLSLTHRLVESHRQNHVATKIKPSSKGTQTDPVLVDEIPTVSHPVNNQQSLKSVLEYMAPLSQMPYLTLDLTPTLFPYPF
ncbi:hypothetical protein BC829DRAFT_420236 [Chytridium lagenaria]|nr:hypothetical protein BC829DRAFT_420236 [Chytridium lagenaria]